MEEIRERKKETFNSSSGEIMEREEEGFELRCCESRKLVGVCRRRDTRTVSSNTNMTH